MDKWFSSCFEAIMMLCFSASWVFSLAKSFKSRSTGGKSLMFMIIILIGYISGLIHKIFFRPDWVFYLYAINLAMVIADICLYFRNRCFERAKSL